MTISGWVGVDLDGTLAEYHGWNGADNIGAPVRVMLERVKNWIDDGVTIKIFTARACIPEQIPPIQKWLKENGLPELEVTNMKDFAMVELWDDRCVHVEANTGKVLG